MKLNIQLFAVPFRKVSKTRKRMRRAHNAMEMPGVTKCSNCGEVIKPHRVCPKCGNYKGKEVVVKTEKTEA
jgi:large subunit ribosomal protein L32